MVLYPYKNLNHLSQVFCVLDEVAARVNSLVKPSIISGLHYY